ncbi:MAG: Asp-tRNA(Asn)/Glu-tRNA(Gln) amidotransferase subunit GatC [Bacteroidota bacterium]
MEINNDIINKLADLAKLDFTDTEKVELQKDMTQIISFFEKMNEVNTDNIEPLIFMTEQENVLRNDEPKHEITHQEALLNAPNKDSDYFRVPKFLEK